LKVEDLEKENKTLKAAMQHLKKACKFVLRDQRRNMSTVTEKSSKAGKKPAKSTAAKKVDAAHPPSSVMVQKAIEGLGEKKGSSLASNVNLEIDSFTNVNQ